jgi:hypothetical protein
MSSSRPRRSVRNRGSNEVIAPGLGTKSDIARLTSDLGSTLPETAVLAMMRSEGRGILSESAAAAAAPDTPTNTSEEVAGVAFTSPSTSNMWADFIQEEGPSKLAGTSSKTDEPPNKKAKNDRSDRSSSSSEKVDYDLAVLTKTEKSPPFGSLVQSGTLDSTIVGRHRLGANETAVYHLTVPTVLMPSVAVTKVCTSCNASHAIAIDRSNQAYGWGRNEGLALGDVNDAKIIPTPQIVATDIATAALGKSHTIFLKTDGSLHALGTNKSGQCGWKEGTKHSGTLKPCLTLSLGKSDNDGIDESPNFCKIACGEDFSVALDDQGIMYTTGSSEFGQLGNGETGEYFVAANKVRLHGPHSLTVPHCTID